MSHGIFFFHFPETASMDLWTAPKMSEWSRVCSLRSLRPGRLQRWDRHSLRSHWLLAMNGHCFWFLWDRVSLCSLGACPRTSSVDQAGLKFRDLPASASLSSEITGMHRHHHLALLCFFCFFSYLYSSKMFISGLGQSRSQLLSWVSLSFISNSLMALWL